MDAARIIAALGVLLSHTVYAYLATYSRPGILWAIVVIGRSAVALFFFVSGWLYALSCHRHGPDVLLPRIRRLSLLFAVAWLLSTLAAGGGPFASGLRPTEIAAAVFFAWPMNTLWFFPALILITIAGHAVLRRADVRIVTVGSWFIFAALATASALPAVLPASLTPDGFPIPISTAVYRSAIYWFATYMTGVLVAQIPYVPNPRVAARLRAFGYLGMALTAAIFVLPAPAHPYVEVFRAVYQRLVPPALAVCIGISLVPGRASVASRALARLAPLTLWVYVLHPMVMTLLSKHADVASWGPWTYSAAVLGITLSLAALIQGASKAIAAGSPGEWAILGRLRTAKRRAQADASSRDS